MIVSFTIGNYLSFKENQTLDFKASSIKDSGLTSLYPTTYRDLRILKSLILFGPNGSGKSNIIKALRFLVGFINDSFKESQINEPINVSYFKFFSDTIAKPSYFEIIFLIDEKIYNYNFSVTKEKVITESLHYKAKTRDYVLFDRNENNISSEKGIVVDERFKEGDGLEKFVRPNSLFLSVVAQFSGTIATTIVKELSKFIFISDTLAYEQVTAKMMEQEKYKNEILNFLRLAGFPFKGIETKRIEIDKKYLEGFPDEMIRSFMSSKAENFSIQTIYDVFDSNNYAIKQEKLDLRTEESHGTRKMFALAGPFVDAILNSKVLVIDEFTARIHPQLASHVLKYFYYRTNNLLTPSQLIVASHNTYLMDKEFFRRDQIILTMRDKFHASNLFSMINKDIRHDASYVKKYFENALGALPELMELDSENIQLDLFKKKDIE